MWQNDLGSNTILYEVLSRVQLRLQTSPDVERKIEAWYKSAMLHAPGRRETAPPWNA